MLVGAAARALFVAARQAAAAPSFRSLVAGRRRRGVGFRVGGAGEATLVAGRRRGGGGARPATRRALRRGGLVFSRGVRADCARPSPAPLVWGRGAVLVESTTRGRAEVGRGARSARPRAAGRERAGRADCCGLTRTSRAGPAAWTNIIFYIWWGQRLPSQGLDPPGRGSAARRRGAPPPGAPTTGDGSTAGHTGRCTPSAPPSAASSHPTWVSGQAADARGGTRGATARLLPLGFRRSKRRCWAARNPARPPHRPPQAATACFGTRGVPGKLVITRDRHHQLKTLG